MDTIISCHDLYRKVNSYDSTLLLIDTRPFSDYNKGHIPSAINIDLMHFHWFDTSTDGIACFNKQMEILLNFLGIKSDSFVVFYDDISGSSASRGVWLLHYFSHSTVYILDGGYKNWIDSKYPVEKKTNPFKNTESKFSINSKVLANASYIKNKIENKDNEVFILDCRSEMEYDGLVVRACKKGHIPGAINIDWIHNLEKGKFKDDSKLLQLYSFIPFDKEIITYCQGGYRAANTYLVLKHLGYSNIKMYLGSWGEWGNKTHFD